MESNQAVDLELKLKELTEALNAEKRRNAELRNDFAAKVDAEADVRATQMVLQRQAVDEDRAEQAKPKVLRRPATYSEFRSYSDGDRSTILSLYGGEQLMGDLLAQKRREDEQAKANAALALLAKHNRKIG
jgi:hypothetical protein